MQQAFIQHYTGTVLARSGIADHLSIANALTHLFDGLHPHSCELIARPGCAPQLIGAIIRSSLNWPKYGPDIQYISGIEVSC
jgi:hypothetical protein